MVNPFNSSPLQKLEDDLLKEKGIELYIKRDDLIHPLVSGNKWRKLKYILYKAKAQQKNHLVTFGGAFSNHLLATAAAAAMFGLKATGFVRGEEVINDHLFLCRMHGMNLIFVDRSSYRDKPALFEKHFAADDSAIFVDEGGASAEGTLGCAEIADELDANYQHLFCACGTGTTAAGILNGMQRNGMDTMLHAIPVLKDGAFIGQNINAYLNQPTPYQLHLDYHFGGYAKTTPGLINFIKNFIAQTGIMIDPVYTGKMLYAVFDMAEKQYFKTGNNILAIHTGGAFGLLGMKDRFV